MNKFPGELWSVLNTSAASEGLGKGDGLFVLMIVNWGFLTIKSSKEIFFNGAEVKNGLNFLIDVDYYAWGWVF